uniref:5'-3' exoribonuclease n=1 Tax=Komagataella phaffii TaxID=460519 RepID=UPI0035CD3D4A
MGVPALFRWLSRKYPKIISPVIQDEDVDIDGESRPTRYEDPNPNGELDNLYLDMNGIVHPCSHPEHKPVPETEDEMMLDVFAYTENVIMMARPRKVIYIAVDGVAPRAKMNQQRSRRFRSAQDAKDANEKKAAELKEMEKKGEIIDDAIKNKKTWDSNAITPGTPFMHRLADSLRYWAAYKLTTDPGWSGIEVIISDASVPGQGQHKIMSYVRSLRSSPKHDPNTTHCIYGLNANLIFLGLATHEPHFKILREDVFAQDKKSYSLQDQLRMTDIERQELKDKKTPFLWLHLNILREYLQIELNVPGLSFPFDLEKSIDDWVFICFFCGNNFLPHLPSLDVRDNSITTLVTIWKQILPTMKGYLTTDGYLNLPAVERLLAELAKKEDYIFRKRYEDEKRSLENQKRRKLAQEQSSARSQNAPNISTGKDKAPLTPNQNIPLYTTSGESVGIKMTDSEMVNNSALITKANEANKSIAELLKQNLQNEINKKRKISNEEQEVVKESVEEVVEEEDDVLVTSDPEDSSTEILIPKNEEIRLWEPGYRKRYYETKFHTKDPQKVKKIARNMVQKYIEGVSWVLLYYYQGCPSWNWYYPYHYAPFAADFVNLSELKIEFVEGTPFRPYEQLMSVLPAASSHNLPDVFRSLMSDANSEIIDFYPEEFPLDMNGKKVIWQAIPLLPFIDENRLLKAVQSKYDQLTEDEKFRNTNRSEILVLGRSHSHYPTLVKELYEEGKDSYEFQVDSSGVSGVAIKLQSFDRSGVLRLPVKQLEGYRHYPDISNRDFLMVEFKQLPKSHAKSMILSGLIPHLRRLTQEDKDSILYGGTNFYGRNRFSPEENADFKQYIGPHGKSQYLPRQGGYKAFIQIHSDEAKGHRHGIYHGGSHTETEFRRGGGYHQHGNRGGRGGYQGNQGYQANSGGYQNSYQGSYQGGYRGGYQGGSQGRYQAGYQSGYQGGYQGEYKNGYQGGYQGNQGNQGYNRQTYNASKSGTLPMKRRHNSGPSSGLEVLFQ